MVRNNFFLSSSLQKKGIENCKKKDLRLQTWNRCGEREGEFAKKQGTERMARNGQKYLFFIAQPTIFRVWRGTREEKGRERHTHNYPFPVANFCCKMKVFFAFLYLPFPLRFCFHILAPILVGTSFLKRQKLNMYRIFIRSAPLEATEPQGGINFE